MMLNKQNKTLSASTFYIQLGAAPLEPSIEEYQRRLGERIKRKEVRCRKCGNKEDFMVNEIGHIFCNKCYTKVPNIRLN